MCCLCLAPILVFSEKNQEKGHSIAKQMALQNSGWKDEVMTLTMELISTEGVKQSFYIRFRVRESERDGDKSLVMIRTPYELKGRTLLTHTHKKESDEYWLYDPSDKKVESLSSKNVSNAFFESDLVYEDLGAYELEKFSYTFLREETVDDRRCFVIQRVPLDVHSTYAKQDVWIDIFHYVPIKIEFYDKKNVLLKIMTFSDYEKYRGGFWRPKTQLMTNVQTGSKTTLRWGTRSFGNGLRLEQFLPENLTRLR